MAAIDKMKNKFGANVCRRCINRRFKVNLTPRDCVYYAPYAQVCPSCGEEHHIVTGLRTTGKLKMLFK